MPADVLDRADATEQDRPGITPGPAPVPRAPWSVVAPSFIREWGYPDGQFQPEHVEILGPSGSGKTYFEATLLQQRVAARQSAVIFVATKPVDATIALLGWPVVGSWKELHRQQARQVIFWPRTREIGEAREKFLEARIHELLAQLWKAKTKVILVFDEVATVEGLSPRLKKVIAMYWREARSVGITLVAMKQRGQGVQRDMHSETAWIAAFRPKHQEDGEYVAMVMGNKREWLPVLRSLDRERHEFVLLHAVTGDAVISWVDTPLQPAVPQPRGVYGRKA